jgi:hypothetical protein
MALITAPLGLLLCFYLHYLAYCYTIGSCSILVAIHKYVVFTGEMVYLGFRWLYRVFTYIMEAKNATTRGTIIDAMEWSKNNLTECLKTEGLHMDVSKWNFTF